MNLRLLALAGVAACAIALPLAVASAGPTGDDARTTVRLPAHASREVRESGAAGAEGAGGAFDGAGGSTGSTGSTESSGSSGVASGGVDAKGSSAGAARTPLLLGVGTATAARCGPELTSPEGVEAETCVLSQGDDTWARTYYRNGTREPLRAVLSLMGPGARTVQMRCAVSAGDEPASCETPRERTRAQAAGYTAVAEFAGTRPDGPLLLRSGSNS